jgi:hypothetical protein
MLELFDLGSLDVHCSLAESEFGLVFGWERD